MVIYGVLRSSLVCLQARSVRCEPYEVDEQKARRRIRRYVENFLRVQRSLAMQIALRSVKILMNSLVLVDGQHSVERHTGKIGRVGVHADPVEFFQVFKGQ